MTRNIYLKDYLVSRLICDDKYVDGYGKIFYQTNEDLIDAYLDVDFFDKSVFSVLSSGDQVLTARFLDAKEVDAFDVNRLSLYYFYLRLWSIKYRNMLYPDLFDDNRWLPELLEDVKPSNELESIVYKFYQKHVNEDTNLENIFYDLDRQEDGRKLYIKAKELEECLSPELDFYDIDLFKENDFDKKYDIVLISNILEWAEEDSNKLEIACNNLDKLVNKDGVVICSNLICRSLFDLNKERDIFSNSFDLDKKGRSYIYRKK